MEEGELKCKLDELDKLERAEKDNKEPAWLVVNIIPPADVPCLNCML